MDSEVRVVRPHFFLYLEYQLMTELELKIKELTESVISGSSTYVVDVEAKGVSGNYQIWVYLDTEEGGIGIDKCAKVSNELGILIEAHEIIDSKYILNVSSPGLDRPLKDLRQYKNNVGRKVKVKWQASEDTVTTKGKLTQFDGDAITVDAGKAGPITINLEQIIETKVLPVW